MRTNEREVLGIGSQVVVLSGVGNSVGEAGFSRKSVSVGFVSIPVETWTCILLWVRTLPGNKDN